MLLSRLLAASLAFFTSAAIAMAQEEPLPPGTIDENAVPAVMGKAVDDFIRPGYRAFEASATRLATAMTSLCGAPSSDALSAAKAAFTDTVSRWSEIEIVRVGPALDGNRFERILFYPDRKGLGLKQVQALIARKDEDDIKPAAIAGKSIAVQGLGALDYVLGGTNSEALMQGKNGFRCRYGAAIAGNIETIAGDLVAAWEKPDGVQAAWKHPGPDNPVFRDGKEAITALLGILVHGAETVRDQRIESFYMGEAETARPKSAIYWRSGNTWTSVSGNLRGLEALWRQSGMAGLLSADRQSVAGSIDFVLKSLLRTAPAINPDIETAIADPKERARIDFLLVNTKDLIVRLNDGFGAAIGLGAGFSFSDGD